MKILKFGGTSVGSPERMKQVANLIQGEENIVVLSAVSGTTNSLVAICSELAAQNKKKATTLINKLYTEYEKFVINLFNSEEFITIGNDIITEHFNIIKSTSKLNFSPKEEKIILAQGELLSTKLFHSFLSEQKINSVLLPALDFMRIDNYDEPALNNISKNLKTTLASHTKSNIYITQGYICLNSNEDIDNLKRGGSDYTATIIGALLRAEEVQIWTDIDGMHNNDPRIVKNTKPVHELTFDEAAELAYFGAKILHPSTVRPAKKFNIPVRILNTMAPDAQGTTISETAQKNIIKAIAAKDNITAINILSSRMLLAHGFLRKVFEIFEKHKTSIDMVTTSEVAVSLTIDDISNIDLISKDLEEYGKISIDRHQTIICIVGDFLAEKPGVVLKAVEALKTIPIRMISYGGSENNISLLVDTKYKSDALNALSRNIFS